MTRGITDLQSDFSLQAAVKRLARAFALGRRPSKPATCQTPCSRPSLPRPAPHRFPTHPPGATARMGSPGGSAGTDFRRWGGGGLRVALLELLQQGQELSLGVRLGGARAVGVARTRGRKLYACARAVTRRAKSPRF